MDTTSYPRARRHELIVVLAVGGVSLLTGILYLWAMHSALDAGISGVPPLPAQAVFVAANTAAAGLLWWHRRYPIRVFAAILGVYVATALSVGFAGNGGLTLPLWFSVFALTAYAPLRRAFTAAAVGWLVSTAVKVYFVLAAGYQLTVAEIGLGFVADVGFFYLACCMLGLGFRFQHQRANDAAERARLVEERSRAVHAEAVATERNRLARDLHDLAAHELMDVLLTVRAMQIGSDHPDLPEIEQKTARALDNMRTVVRTLREEDRNNDPDRLPLPEAATRLLDTLRTERDIDVRARIDLPVTMDDATASTVLSVLTETILNSVRHAPGMPITVVLDSEASSLRLTVTNPTSPTDAGRRESTGYGLIGAAERAGLLGGTFDARQAANGHWTAMLRLPLDATPAKTSPMKEA